MVTAASLTAAPWRSLSATFAYHLDTDSVLWPVILVAHHRHRNRADDFGVLEVADWCPGQRRGHGSTPSGTSRTAPRRRGRLEAGDTLLRAQRPRGWPAGPRSLPCDPGQEHEREGPHAEHGEYHLGHACLPSGLERIDPESGMRDANPPHGGDPRDSRESGPEGASFGTLGRAYRPRPNRARRLD